VVNHSWRKIALAISAELMEQVALEQGDLLLGRVVTTGPLRTRHRWAPGRLHSAAAGPSRSDRGNTERPEDRTFQRAGMVGYVQENRPRLVDAALA
jgi:hypothetical protein